MARKLALTKEQRQKHDAAGARVSAAYAKLVEALGAYATAVQEAHEKLSQEVDAYNDAIVHAKVVADVIATEMDGIACERTDRWRESPQGEAGETFVAAWGDLELEEFELPEPDELEAPEDPTEAWNALPMAPQADDE